MEVGDQVTVTLPPDISPWRDETKLGATWEAEIVYVNGDSDEAEDAVPRLLLDEAELARRVEERERRAPKP